MLRYQKRKDHSQSRGTHAEGDFRVQILSRQRSTERIHRDGPWEHRYQPREVRKLDLCLGPD